MSISTKDLLGMSLVCTDGELGSVKDVYFEDRSWILCYAVVDTGDWLPGRLVLVSFDKIVYPSEEMNALPTTLSKGEVKEAPGLFSKLPVNLQKRIDLREYTVWAPSWSPMGSPVG